jgi:starvation-inducible outer membrane lipoprotein
VREREREREREKNDDFFRAKKIENEDFLFFSLVAQKIEIWQGWQKLLIQNTHPKFDIKSRLEAGGSQLFIEQH